MNKRADVIRAMHEKGMTYEEIGEVFGITKQAAHQAAMGKNYFHEATARKVKYVGLRNWLIENRVSIAELDRRCGLTKVHASLIGKFGPRKKTIDAILSVTGMTYEECFREESVDTDD